MADNDEEEEVVIIDEQPETLTSEYEARPRLILHLYYSVPGHVIANKK